MKTYYQTSVEIAEKEVVIQRHFNAPRSLVYRAWTDPAILTQWWGPHSFTLPVCEVDLRVDGLYRYVMRSPEGQDFPMVGRYVEIVPDEKLVTTDALDDHPQEWFDLLKGFMGVTQFSDPLDILVTTTFTEHRGGTLVTIRSTFSSNAVRDGFIKMGMGEGWAESLDKAELHLATLDPGTDDRSLIADRLFDAPVELVFEMWTEPAHITNWWGPDGFSTTTHSIDFHPRGFWKFTMHGPDGTDYPNVIKYLEIDRPYRIVYAHGSTESDIQFHVDVRLESKGRQTRLLMRMLMPTVEERNRKADFGAREGLKQTMNRLKDYIEVSQLEKGK